MPTRFFRSEVERFFEPSVSAIAKCIKAITAETDPAKTFVFLAGGFGASPWLFREVGREIGLKLSRPDTQTYVHLLSLLFGRFMCVLGIGRLRMAPSHITLTILSSAGSPGTPMGYLAP